MMISDLYDAFMEDRRVYCVDYTLQSYTFYLNRFINWLPGNDTSFLSKDSLKKYILYLRGTMKNVSVRTCYRPVKAFCKWAYQEGFLDSDITIGVKLPKNDAALVEPLSSKEVYMIDDCIINSFSAHLSLRNYCMFHLMLDCGLRRKEVVNLEYKDIRETRIIIRNGKGNKDRLVYLPRFLYLSINNYYSEAHIDNNCPALFLDHRCRVGITTDTVKDLFQDLKKLSGVSRIHAHLCRHTFATSYLQYGGDIEKLRLLMGHSDYEILKNYLHLSLVYPDVYRLDDMYYQKV